MEKKRNRSSPTGAKPDKQAAPAERVPEMAALQHRVKNDMQLIVSLLSLQAMQETDPEARRKFNQMSMRIRLLALIQEQLYRSGHFDHLDLGGYVRSLGPTVAPPGSPVQLEIEAPSIAVPLQRGTPIALMIGELVRNCFEHAFPGRENGTVKLTIADQGTMIRIVVEDDGVGMQTDGDTADRGFGLRLVRALARQAAAKIELTVENGTRVAIAFPR